jgi:hypothetical protein
MKLSKLNSFRIKYWMVLDSLDVWASTRKLGAFASRWLGWVRTDRSGDCVAALEEKQCLTNELERRLILSPYLTSQRGVRNGI